MAFLILWLATTVWAAPLEVITHTVIESQSEIDKSRFGGISGVAYHEGRMLFLSDDRGKYGDSRVYFGELKFENKKLSVTVKSAAPLRKVPTPEKSSPSLDPEGLAWLPGGDFLVSTEADGNLKPRTRNRLLRFKSGGEFVAEYEFPKAVQSESTGQQKTGTYNNAGPEGLSLCEDGTLWTAMEKPLVQDKIGDRFVRLDRWRAEGDRFKADKDFRYELAMPQEGDAEIIRGVSAILCLGKGRLLVLERTAHLTKSGIAFGGGLYLTECTKDGKGPCKKEKWLDLTGGLATSLNARPNFEGLSWGPTLDGKTKTILMVSDNNFAGSEGTYIVLLALKE